MSLFLASYVDTIFLLETDVATARARARANTASYVFLFLGIAGFILHFLQSLIGNVVG